MSFSIGKSVSAANAEDDSGPCHLNYDKERKWDPYYLKDQVKEVGLTKDFNLYQIRLWRSYLSIFFVLHILVTIGHCLLLLVFAEIREMIYIDVAVYSGCAVLLLSILSINFCDALVARHNWVMLFSSALGASILLSAATYHYHSNTKMVVASFYDVYIVFVIYMYLPIPSVCQVLVLGTTASLIYMVHFIAFMTTEIHPKQLLSSGLIIDAAHYMCLNLMGIFYRITTNMMVRSSFLDRHQYVKEELWLRNAKWHEKVLVDSILPPQISKSLQSEIRRRITVVQQGLRVPITTLQRSMAVQIHPEVSILYADVVNYTRLSTTLNVETLINILHDLYGRFDKAALMFRVQRIKFLGDCYYCVAGIIEADPDHAKNCVDLGFAMISDIQEVREIYDVDINMRIGVHSGTIFAGVLGEAKLQFDIWGTDATIADVLESTGLPGCVHVSSRTLSYIDEEAYEIEPAPSWAAEHPLLIKYQVQSYILRSYRYTLIDNKFEENIRFYSLVRSKSPTNLQAKNENETLEDVFREQLHEEFQKMPVFRWIFLEGLFRHRQYDADSNIPNISPVCLTYRDKDMENLYLNQKDYIFKYSMLLAYCIACLLVILQFDSHTAVCYLCTTVNTFVLVSFGILTFIAWYKKMCWSLNQVRSREDPTYNKFSCFMFYLVTGIQHTVAVRIGIYLFITISHGIIIALIMILCNQNSYILNEIEAKVFHYEPTENECFNPWVITNMMSIFICMAFTFINIPLTIKTLVAFLLSLGYLLLINRHLAFVFHHSYSSSPSLPAEYAHTMQILITILTVYQKERMTTFASKVNFKWRQELKKKQIDAALTNQSITILLHNILPAHVINVYLNSLAKHELYYENYQMVSVMFAMLMNFQMDLKNLRILNDIITEFDILLLYYKEYYVIEKIKVVGCTYMAACGLDLNFAGSVSINARRSTINDPTKSKAQGNLLMGGDESELEDLDEVVFVLASFALDLMRTLSKCKRRQEEPLESISVCNGSITIGLSSGEVMAGIVGASQPHYDIWGDAVNMASRMQSTGLADNIHVSEESAIILKDFGVKCNYRGLTYVKGRGEMPTYLVGIDKDYSFIDEEASRIPSRDLRNTQISFGSAYSKQSDRSKASP
ncbi:adenylyl cyclase X E isoform X2 [Drosophila ananassae]|uniref:adenylyl cyclase X E isoform X2 n=1 Tax=Drosophila ananassae TaxID=7217 RepID=UPI0013A5D0D0|nr:adenylyl cyclase X E isoform X2 [Drosophila ananassae]